MPTLGHADRVISFVVHDVEPSIGLIKQIGDPVSALLLSGQLVVLTVSTESTTLNSSRVVIVASRAAQTLARASSFQAQGAKDRARGKLRGENLVNPINHDRFVGWIEWVGQLVLISLHLTLVPSAHATLGWRRYGTVLSLREPCAISR